MGVYSDKEFNYVFSGSLTNQMLEMLRALDYFQPMCLLESQINRKSVKDCIELRKQGLCKWLLVDSGAFSVHTGKYKCTEQDYLDYINEIVDDVDMFAQLDTIPGQLNKPKTPQDYVESAEKSWDNFLFLRDNIKDRKKNKHKIMPVYHFKEDISYLDQMLDYVDQDGDRLEYIGLAPAKDASAAMQVKYMEDMFNHIAASSHPDIKTHLYGFTNLMAIKEKKFPATSADSISHRLIAGYNKIYTRAFNKISIAKKPRKSKVKSAISFLDAADEYNLNVLRKEFTDKGMDLEFARKFGFEGDDILDFATENLAFKVVFNILTIQDYERDINSCTKKKVKSKKLFDIP